MNKILVQNHIISNSWKSQKTFLSQKKFLSLTFCLCKDIKNQNKTQEQHPTNPVTHWLTLAQIVNWHMSCNGAESKFPSINYTIYGIHVAFASWLEWNLLTFLAFLPAYIHLTSGKFSLKDRNMDLHQFVNVLPKGKKPWAIIWLLLCYGSSFWNYLKPLLEALMNGVYVARRR